MVSFDEPSHGLSRRQQRHVARYHELASDPHKRLCAQLRVDGWPETTGPLTDLDTLVTAHARLKSEHATLEADLRIALADIAELERHLQRVDGRPEDPWQYLEDDWWQCPDETGQLDQQHPAVSDVTTATDTDDGLLVAVDDDATHRASNRLERDGRE